jgi:hypothetical protein
MRHCGRNCCETFASLQQLFILPGSCFRGHLSSYAQPLLDPSASSTYPPATAGWY